MPHALDRQLLTRFAVILLALTLAMNLVRPGLAQTESATAVGEPATAGPWAMTVQEVALGDDAAAKAAEASASNPSAEDGLQYVAVRLTVQNTSAQSLIIGLEDFGVLGEAGIVRRSAGIFPPSPALEGSIAAGESLEGWILSSVEAESSNVVLLYDSVTLTGTWADHAFALTDGAAFDPSQERVAELNRDGRDPSAPVGVGQQISTPEWTVEILEVVTGQAVVDISSLPVQRLAQNYIANGYEACFETWVAIRVDVANNGGDGLTRFLSPTAFQLAESNGDAVLDVRQLTAPEPDISGEYAAGGSRTGWIAYELPSGCDVGVVNLFYEANLIRFQPFTTSEDVRFLTWESDFTPAEPTAEPEPFDPDSALAAGDSAVTNEMGVRLRDEPSTEGEILEELDEGVVVEITGEFTEGDGYVWYPVRVDETDEEGWIVQDFLDPAD
jgi:hypothetical protein